MHDKYDDAAAKYNKSGAGWRRRLRSLVLRNQGFALVLLVCIVFYSFLLFDRQFQGDASQQPGVTPRPRHVPVDVDSSLHPTTTTDASIEQQSTTRVYRASYHLSSVQQLESRSRLDKITHSRIRPSDESYKINVTASERISSDREIMDSRMSICKNWYNLDSWRLPQVSVVIPFHNEPITMIARCLHSILNRTPMHLLREIIIVDDASFNDDMKQPLDEYVKNLPKIDLYRMKSRVGLIRTRMFGLKKAAAPVVVFLDAHNEVNVDWYEPIAEYISTHPTAVVQPVVDDIDADSIEYAGSNSAEELRGGFAWDMRYVWVEMNEAARIAARKARAFPTITLVGCAIAVDKAHFLDLGAFDEEMDIWGGENIETAFRAWMCGASVMTVPCSRVGHTFKKDAKFSFDFAGKSRETVVAKNVMRTAELWMGDRYKRYFYAVLRAWPFKRASFTPDEAASIMTRRKWLDEKFQCKNFEWFLTHISGNWNEPREDMAVLGEVFNEATSSCLSMLSDHYIGMTDTCFKHRIYPNEVFFVTKLGQLKHVHYERRCVVVEKGTFLLKLGDCGESPKWSISDNYGQLHVIVDGSTMCVSHVTNIADEAHYDNQMAQAGTCKDNDDYQVWWFTYRLNWNESNYDIYSNHDRANAV